MNQPVYTGFKQLNSLYVVKKLATPGFTTRPLKQDKPTP